MGCEEPVEDGSRLRLRLADLAPRVRLAGPPGAGSAFGGHVDGIALFAPRARRPLQSLAVGSAGGSADAEPPLRRLC